MKNALFIILLFIALSPASAQKHRPHKDTAMGWSLSEHSILFKLKDTIQLKILDYWPAGVACGILETASNCVGLTTNNDTIRVLTLCNLDNTFKPGMIIIVTPINYEPHLNQVSVWPTLYKGPDGYTYAPVELKKLKTTWGEIELKD